MRYGRFRPIAAIGYRVLNETMMVYFKRTLRFFGLIMLVPFLIGFTGSWTADGGFLLFCLGCRLLS